MDNLEAKDDCAQTMFCTARKLRIECSWYDVSCFSWGWLICNSFADWCLFLPSLGFYFCSVPYSSLLNLTIVQVSSTCQLSLLQLLGMCLVDKYSYVMLLTVLDANAHYWLITYLCAWIWIYKCLFDKSGVWGIAIKSINVMKVVIWGHGHNSRFSNNFIHFAVWTDILAVELRLVWTNLTCEVQWVGKCWRSGLI